MNSSYVIGSVAVVTLVTVAVYAYGNSGLPAASEVSPPTEIDSFVNPEYAVEAPPSTGAISAPVGGGTGAAGELAEFLGSMLASPGAVLGGITLVGQVADFANPGVRKNTEDVLREAGLEKDLRDFQKRQDGYDMVSGRIEDHMITNSDNVLKGAPPLVQDFGRGVAKGLGDLANAPVEVAAVLDSSIMGQIGEFKDADTDFEKALVVIGAKDAIVTGIVFDGIGGGLADMIAKTPEEREKAQEVLDLLNPSKQIDRVVGIAIPAIQASLNETTARLAREKKERDDTNRAFALAQRERDLAFRLSARATADRIARDHKAVAESMANAGRVIADRLAREKEARDEAARVLGLKIASDMAAWVTKNNALIKVETKATEDARKARQVEVEAQRVREHEARNEKAREHALDLQQKIAEVFNREKAQEDLRKIADAFSREKVEEGWNKIEDAFSKDKVEAGWNTTTKGITDFFTGKLF